jgi:hypothetical protein
LKCKLKIEPNLQWEPPRRAATEDRLRRDLPERDGPGLSPFFSQWPRRWDSTLAAFSRVGTSTLQWQEKGQRRNCDGFGLKFRQCFSQPREIRGIGEDGEVRVAAKLGRAEEHARLSAHQQGADAVRAHRRKDFAYRVRDQVSLPARDKSARVSRSPPSVEPA